jgi:glycosyltransferase involved in cell wall biosynthesis
MRLHAILLTRDAEDVIEQNLCAALGWADQIYVQDTGSVDRTLEKLRTVSKNHPRVVLLPEREIDIFHDGLRADVFKVLRNSARDGDWIVHLDEDEFFHNDPREFVTALCKEETAVWSQLFEFRLTRSEMARLSSDDEIRADRGKPLVDRRRYYQILEYSEPRLFKYRKSMIWTARGGFPHNAGYVARRRIGIRHYPHRDPVQLRARLRLRREMLKKLPAGTYPHWHLSLEELVLDESTAGLFYWTPGTELTAPPNSTHLASMPKRIAQRLLHTYAVRAVDRVRAIYMRAGA